MKMKDAYGPGKDKEREGKKLEADPQLLLLLLLLLLLKGENASGAAGGEIRRKPIRRRALWACPPSSKAP